MVCAWPPCVGVWGANCEAVAYRVNQPGLGGIRLLDSCHRTVLVANESVSGSPLLTHADCAKPVLERGLWVDGYRASRRVIQSLNLGHAARIDSMPMFSAITGPSRTFPYRGMACFDPLARCRRRVIVDVFWCGEAFILSGPSEASDCRRRCFEHCREGIDIREQQTLRTRDAGCRRRACSPHGYLLPRVPIASSIRCSSCSTVSPTNLPLKP